MMSLKNTIAHVLEHQDYLEQSNEATAQQYVVLPILRDLGWNDSDLSSREVLPEYTTVGGQRVDYALTLAAGQEPKVLIECKKWDALLERHEEQICFYAYSINVPIAIITNGKVWRFYLSWWKAPGLSGRVFCETDIANPESASNLEAYLLKSNVESGDAELDAEIELENREAPDPRPVEPDPVPPQPANLVDGPWTIDRVRNSIPSDFPYDYSTLCARNVGEFYSRVAELQNLIAIEGWELTAAFRKNYCGFYYRGNRVFGILPRKAPKFVVWRPEQELIQLDPQYERYDRVFRYGAYSPGTTVNQLRPILAFAYRKHSGTQS
ncbi:hypothetical protein C6495_10660 [Candidatus Poribacteria bacterium]|nr:MAG: hypothetical protein C6495_10660 [Candidatus Poribacteria bacterium]